ncbi:RecQ family ATP-dependent DNA helicase [Algibacter amylolyticus]|uniref:ATP-dependent DNA helicase RecQ n=1 Tax=Algibacter amylolyticus TaxID=1608400 RepID=A0A5M7BBN0_9FLAO|nr:RecQ family ATP-dependent DNA helicase [Algibacter amylolyticus]KAA5824781.1 RecQ family ATP-dependent DNA helicase [Algibacter amylolyticus]MBB5268895.1 ATP-dependent DNA helicase RecQ [Algibacter amylolyticus]TSJ75946.1 RecQ family ATP-dependent DNA helicase [Algibacter amylolyticus]
MEHPINILERYWKYTSFRPQQEAIINSVIAGEDTFVLLPTGGGKSMCFQIPALAKKGICIVVSPLIALMKDQVLALNNKGIKAMAITSGISYKELDTLLDNCIYGNYKFLYLSPERLQQELVQSRIQQMPVNLIAVDEAHCISQWGSDFRPAYKNITLLRQLQPSVNVVALTASAKPEVVQDIVNELDFIDPKIFKQSFYRPNLAYMVFHENDKYYRLETILKKYSASSIIYVRNRKQTLDISAFLSSKKITATHYHGGLSNVEKDANMAAWLNNQKQVMVATNAFGMGIDKPDVKTVIHLTLPESIESYFQEAGRVGRNGDKAFAVILKNDSDKALVKNQFLSVLPTVSLVKQVYRKLCNYFQISYGEGEYLTFDFDFNTFCKTYKFSAITCYNALLILDRNSIITLSKQFKNKVTVQFIISNKALFNYLETHQNFGIIVKSILRLYGGVFDHVTKIDLKKICEKAAISEGRLTYILQELEKDEIITLNLAKTDAQVTFIEPREDDKTINRIAKTIEQQNKLKQGQVKAMLDYVENELVCKSIQLLSYFGETEAENCGICSVCIQAKHDKKKPVDGKTLKKRVIELLENGDQSSRAMVKQLQCEQEVLKPVLKLLLEHQIIVITPTNTYKLSHL